MKVLCNPNKEDGKRHYRWFNLLGMVWKYKCSHCRKIISFADLHKNKIKLKDHTCKARIKELTND